MVTTQERRYDEPLSLGGSPFMTVITHDVVPAGEDLPILLQQAPKSLAQGSTTVLRALLDPTLGGK